MSREQELESRVEQWNAQGWMTAFEQGEPVVVTNGPLQSLEAIFERYIPGKQRCEVLISLMGRPQRVKVDITDLHSFSAHQRFAQLE